MKLKNRNPEDFLNETILHEKQPLQVIDVTAEGIHAQSNLRGVVPVVLSLDQFAMCEPYPARDFIRARYPTLLRAMRYASILSHGEAESALYGLIMLGLRDLGCEAVSNAGGSGQVIRHAWRCRHHVRRLYADARNQTVAEAA